MLVSPTRASQTGGRGCSLVQNQVGCEVNKALRHIIHVFDVILQVSVLRGAPETVRELLGTLGLQKYTLGLSLHGWDDLDYFR